MNFTKILSILSLGSLLLGAQGVMAAGDPVAGKKVAKKCAICHTLTKDGIQKLGPNLYDILGKPAGKIAGYKYSDAMLNSGLTWDATTFTDFITKPKKFVKGTKMGFRGIRKASQRADLLAYFNTLRDTPMAAGPVGNAENGIKSAARYCADCHTFEKGGKVIYGPNLFGSYGQRAATIKGYSYSAALMNSGLVWNDVNLDSFMANPEQFVKGTIARFPGLKSAQSRADILAYLKTLK
ncbi:MAG: c-type cytochrome [Pseudomonas marincola]